MANITFGLGFDPAYGILNLNVFDSQGNLAASGVQGSAGATAAVTLSTPGAYFIDVSGQTAGTTNLYNLSAEFQNASDGTVYYVNDGSMVDDYYTLAPGNDANNGTSPLTPKASVQSVLNTYAWADQPSGG